MIKRLLCVLLFALFLVPTLVSYQPYTFTWDDSDYLGRSLLVGKAFWSADWGGMMQAMPSIRPPMMTLLAIPWGPWAGWETVGHCFVTLFAAEAFFVGLCLYMLLRIGTRPVLLVLAALCVCASLGSWPQDSVPHIFATAFMADSLYAWTILAAFLLIPYELRERPGGSGDDLRRGLLWGGILEAGCLMKASFLCVALAVGPLTVFLRARRRGRASSLRALAVMTLCSLPTALYWLVYGGPALRNGWAASFGKDAGFYHVPLREFIRFTRHNSPGMWMTVLALVGFFVWLFLRRPPAARSAALAPIAIALFFCGLALSSSNREIRYFFPVLVSLPFLLAQFLSLDASPVGRREAIGSAALAFAILLVPGYAMKDRVDRRSFRLCEMVLEQAQQLRAQRVLLATDSPNLNLALLVATSEAGYPRSPFVLDSLACTFQPLWEEDLRKMGEFDLLVVQDAKFLNPPWTNQRAKLYEECARRGGEPVWASEEIRVYRIGR